MTGVHRNKAHILAAREARQREAREREEQGQTQQRELQQKELEHERREMQQELRRLELERERERREAEIERERERQQGRERERELELERNKYEQEKREREREREKRERRLRSPGAPPCPRRARTRAFRRRARTCAGTNALIVPEEGESHHCVASFLLQCEGSSVDVSAPPHSGILSLAPKAYGTPCHPRERGPLQRFSYPRA